MIDWIKCRKKIGMSQFRCAQASGVSRMRLSLAETGQLELTAAEGSAVQQALNDFILRKAREISQLLLEQELQHAAPASLSPSDAGAYSFPELGKIAEENYGGD